VKTRDQRVALLVQDLAGGGAERVMLNLARGLVELGRPVDMVMVRAQGPYLDQVPGAVRVVELKTGRVMRSGLALVRYLRRERPAVMISALPHVNVLAVLSGKLGRTGVPVVLTEHSVIAQSRADCKRVAVRLAYGVMPWVYPWADRVVAVSGGVAESLRAEARVDDRRLRVIHNPITEPIMTERAHAPSGDDWLDAQPPAAGDQAGRRPTLVAVGRLHPLKGFDTLLRAVALLRGRCPARLIVLGEGPERERLTRLVAELGLSDCVRLPGFVANPYAWIKRADALVMTSRWEGFGNVLVEAMAVGTPVVSTDCPVGPREILADGRYGRLVPPDDPEALAGAIADTLAAPPAPDRLIERAGDFSIDRICRAYEDLIHELRPAAAEPTP